MKTYEYNVAFTVYLDGKVEKKRTTFKLTGPRMKTKTMAKWLAMVNHINANDLTVDGINVITM